MESNIKFKTREANKRIYIKWQYDGSLCISWYRMVIIFLEFVQFEGTSKNTMICDRRQKTMTRI